MTRGEKAVWLWILSISGMFACVLVGVIWLPGLAREKSAVLSMKSQVNTLLSEEAQAKKQLESLQSEMAEFQNLIETKKGELFKAVFAVKPDSGIAAFVEDLQKMLVIPGLSILNLSYRTREIKNGFVTLPFELKCEADYQAFRNLIYRIENSPDAIHIDRLEFQSFDNEHHNIQFIVQCSIRFKQGA